MRRMYLNWWAGWLPFLLALLVGVTERQIAGDVHLTVRLRASDGTAVTGETIMLERLPEEEPMPCVTDADGVCTWLVGWGLYQVLFTRPLDGISALAVAEGGLRGLGLTVGDADITYHFTFHSDGRVYFDSAPEAAVPAPLMPVGEAWHGGIVSTPSPVVAKDEPVNETPPPATALTPDTAVPSPTSGSFWRLLLFFGGGLALGGII
ncbi:MAG TPA: hypothetical protein PLD25_29320, partial [Chloroflexota bacterium]|nr:hypothetical protein [Chloroflexota bacterium]